MKPVKTYAKIIQALSCNNKIVVRAGTTIPLHVDGEKVCIIIHAGSFSVYRRHRRMMLGHSSAPMTIGLSFLFPENKTTANNSVYLISTSELVYEVVNASSEAREKITQADLWRDVATCIAYAYSAVVSNFQRFSGQSSENLVYEAIQLFASHTSEFKNRILLVEYIRSRTLLSRSAIMLILRKLRLEKKIVIDRGHLVEISDTWFKSE
ncbi:helix-turn-helix domain-containing protein [Klebsiella aerogenes]|uniref:helix-turn-helix domain-containing protein n=1 Tax=Klebsiella aerogenes TaxID=548 RepID=UPI0013D1EFB9|nr:helix-turn-helix domain-containing protein [Klebsiella aerogenes]EKZ5856007.1 helix-turn-helix domain-containing protein [Klebsiella aerogenes]EKZ6550419.1 helix-turn-helix domain-containing protein [Klebsiella aerogenes]EKZ6676777.1 helix-turn-helix domain-containing protein [Klebsiella aerogenes]